MAQKTSSNEFNKSLRTEAYSIEYNGIVQQEMDDILQIKESHYMIKQEAQMQALLLEAKERVLRNNLKRSIATTGSVLESDSLALVAIYNAMDGDNWGHPSNWLVGPVDQWDEVWVTNGRVSHIFLSNRNLNGYIPKEIGDLTDLIELWLYHSIDLTGPIPPEIGNLTKLRELWLSYCSLSGNIPPELGDLTSLTILRLGDNKLVGSIPEELKNLTELTMMSFGLNQLSGNIPAWIGDLTKLKTLNLIRNQLSGSIPSEIGKLTSLQGLYLYMNQLSGIIPPELGNLSKLTRLDLKVNQLSGNIPVEIENLTNLTELNFADNQLSGNIPVGIENLTNLTELNLADNQLSGNIPVGIENLTNLTELNLSYNQLSGEIPVELGNLTELTELYIADNELEGAIPPELGNLAKVELISFWKNKLSGTIPVELSKLINLYYLNLSINELSGIIPEEFSSMLALNYFYFAENKYIGSFPEWIGDLANLRRLRFNDNTFDSIPESILNLNQLDVLESFGNNLTFEELYNLPLNGGAYAPQKTINISDTLYVQINKKDTLFLDFDNAVLSNSYNWQKDGQYFVSTSENMLEIIESKQNDTVYYSVRITNPDFSDLTLQTDSIVVVVGENISTNIQDESIKPRLAIYPNPTKDFIAFDVSSFPAYIEMYNIQGEKMLSQELKINKHIAVGHLKKGIYVYVVIQGDQIQSGKILIEE